MTDRYDLLIASMQEAARTVTILFGLACAILIARYSIRWITPPADKSVVRNYFDLWLVVMNLVLFLLAR
jgi:hypothetical protein